jgi:LacI family transcriptional regulator
VGIENREGTKNLIRYLLGLGHTQIAIIEGDLKNQSARARFYGFSEALEENNIKPDERYIMTGNWTKESARQATLELIKLDKRPTAIFASSDEMAYEAIITLRENNIRVPDDISVAGFDDSPFSTISEVPITTVHQPIYEMARESCEILVNILKEPKQPPIKKLLNTNLVKRESCKKIG